MLAVFNTANSISIMETFKFIKVGKSLMTLYQSPTDEQIKQLKNDYKLTLVVSILPSFEHNCINVKKTCEANKIGWFQIPLTGSNQKELKESGALLTSKVIKLWNLLNLKEEVFLVHCKYGVRRTGIVAYALLRISGLDKKAAIDQIGIVRSKINESISKSKLDYVDNVLLPSIVLHSWAKSAHN